MQNKKPTQFVQAYIPLNPFAPEEKRVPALPVYAVPVSPVAAAHLQRNPALFISRPLVAVSALIKKGPQRATVSVTASAQADVAFRLSIAFCLRRAFTGGSDPAFANSRI